MTVTAIRDVSASPLTRHTTIYLGFKRKRLTPASERGYLAVLRAFVADFPDRDIEDFEPPAGAILCAALRRRRLERASLRLADAEHDLEKWGWANTPSEDARAEERIEKLRQKVEALTARCWRDRSKTCSSPSYCRNHGCQL